jgi:hypothetical protein
VFQPSITIASAARAFVAESAGVQADADLLTSAGRSLDAVAQRWNRMKWKFLQSEQYISLTAPISVSGVSVTAGSTTMQTTVASGFASILIDDLISASGARPETLVLSGTGAASTALTMNVAASSTVTGIVASFRRPIYALATDFRAVYDIRLTSAPRPLFYVQRRTFNRAVYDQTSAGTVAAYDLYLVGDRGKVRFISPPLAADTALVRYLRRITMPTVASASVLDIPHDYEDVFIACAKAHFLADKKESGTRLQFWMQYAKDGMREMKHDEAFLPDDINVWEPPTGSNYPPEQRDSLTEYWPY